MSDLIRGEAWRALAEHHGRVAGLHLRELFAADPDRGERMTAEAAGLYLDWSKNRVTAETLELLDRLAEEAALADRIEAMFEGQRINVTEDRPALHVALRAPREETFLVDGENVVPAVHEVLDRMAGFAERVRSGEWTGHTGRPIRNVVNVGIGGSALGPAMLLTAVSSLWLLDRGWYAVAWLLPALALALGALALSSWIPLDLAAAVLGGAWVAVPIVLRLELGDLVDALTGPAQALSLVVVAAAAAVVVGRRSSFDYLEA